MAADSQSEDRPAWDEYVIESVEDAVMAVGAEGLNRLLFDPTKEAREVLEEWLQQHVETAGYKYNLSGLETLAFDLAVEAGNLGVKLGFAMARALQAGPLPSTWEEWLQSSIKLAKLDDHEVMLQFDVPKPAGEPLAVPTMEVREITIEPGKDQPIGAAGIFAGIYTRLLDDLSILILNANISAAQKDAIKEMAKAYERQPRVTVGYTLNGDELSERHAGAVTATRRVD